MQQFPSERSLPAILYPAHEGLHGVLVGYGISCHGRVETAPRCRRRTTGSQRRRGLVHSVEHGYPSTLSLVDPDPALLELHGPRVVHENHHVVEREFCLGQCNGILKSWAAERRGRSQWWARLVFDTFFENPGDVVDSWGGVVDDETRPIPPGAPSPCALARPIAALLF